MEFKRSSGVVLHPSSLPGAYGIGGIGLQALHWIDFLSSAGSGLWQVLPLGPTGYGDSPYQCFSSFAGNPYLISVETLLKDGMIEPDDLGEIPTFPVERVDYGQVIPWKIGLLDRAYDRFAAIRGRSSLRTAFHTFTRVQAAWLDDFALFMTLKDLHGGAPWPEWDEPLRSRQPEALAGIRREYAQALERHKFRQFLFFRQWNVIRKYAHRNKIRIIGDIPIFVAHDSADVWANPDLFYLDATGRPTVIAGVPPDYFSKTGQRWGNPLYRWDAHQATGYAWWLNRLRAVLKLVDVVRIDHFRGFVGYWEVPGRAKTAIRGRWVAAPGFDFFNKVKMELGELPFIAEDLGVITPDVDQLRESFGLPGMKILQFGFGVGPKDPFLPHNLPTHCVMYTGTHDNDTARGWYERVSDEDRDFTRRYLARDGSDISWDMIRTAWGSVAVYALAPMQDLLSLGNEARMNYPGNPSGNWQWRMKEEDMNEWIRSRLWEVNYLYDRLAK